MPRWTDKEKQRLRELAVALVKTDTEDEWASLAKQLSSEVGRQISTGGARSCATRLQPPLRTPTKRAARRGHGWLTGQKLGAQRQQRHGRAKRKLEPDFNLCDAFDKLTIHDVDDINGYEDATQFLANQEHILKMLEPILIASINAWISEGNVIYITRQPNWTDEQCRRVRAFDSDL